MLNQPAHPPISAWSAPAPILLRLLFGLVLFGAGEACLLASGLGNTPWTVLAEGVALNSPLSVGAATVAISFVVLMVWIPLRQAPGLGTLANAVIVGVTIDPVLAMLPDDPGTGAAIALMTGGIALVAIGSGFYLTAALGPGPRDGLMTGFSRRTGSSLRLVRGVIEVSVLVGGAILGGTVGIGTLAFALAIGPGVQLAVERLETERWRTLMAFRG